MWGVGCARDVDQNRARRLRVGCGDRGGLSAAALHLDGPSDDAVRRADSRAGVGRGNAPASFSPLGAMLLRPPKRPAIVPVGLRLLAPRNGPRIRIPVLLGAFVSFVSFRTFVALRRLQSDSRPKIRLLRQHQRGPAPASFRVPASASADSQPTSRRRVYRPTRFDHECTRRRRSLCAAVGCDAGSKYFDWTDPTESRSVILARNRTSVKFMLPCCVAAPAFPVSRVRIVLPLLSTAVLRFVFDGV